MRKLGSWKVLDRFTLVFPHSCCFVSSLDVLDAASNKITGTIPLEYGELWNLGKFFFCVYLVALLLEVSENANNPTFSYVSSTQRGSPFKATGSQGQFLTISKIFGD